MRDLCGAFLEPRQSITAPRAVCRVAVGSGASPPPRPVVSLGFIPSVGEIQKIYYPHNIIEPMKRIWARMAVC